MNRAFAKMFKGFRKVRHTIKSYVKRRTIMKSLPIKMFSINLKGGVVWHGNAILCHKKNS